MPSLRALPGSVGRLQPRRATITPTAVVLCGLLVVLACAPITALAGYPDRPIRVVVPFAPGGYALLMATFAHAVNPSLNTKLPYDTFRAFDPVALVARSFNIVVVNPK